MERKIGEIFEYNDEWYQCLKGISCKECDFSSNSITCDIHGAITCTRKGRSDDTSVVFKKLEKVGGIYAHNSIIVQKYKIRTVPVIMPSESYMYFNAIDNTIEIEIKQNKEDMEGKTNLYEKQTPLQKLMEIYCDGRMNYNEFEKKVKELYSDKYDDSEPILKPFDLEAAKAGKPVCTRDGRKARIICFDAKGDKPIIALIEMGVAETPNNYPIDGKAISIKETPCDLMMLPEKKEGWVNVYKYGLLGARIYKTRKEAYDIASPCDYVDAVKISWEE